MKRNDTSLTMQICLILFFNSLVVLTYIPHTGRVNEFQIWIYKDNKGIKLSLITEREHHKNVCMSTTIVQQFKKKLAEGIWPTAKLARNI